MKNRIFRDRMDGVAVISAEEAIAYGWTGLPALDGRALRRAQGSPVSGVRPLRLRCAGRLDGDNYDRFAVRMEEIRQSMRILEQALDQIRPAPSSSTIPASRCRPRVRVYNTIEGMIGHFKQIVDGVKIPPAKPTATPRAAMASWASTWCPTALGVLIAAMCARLASS